MRGYAHPTAGSLREGAPSFAQPDQADEFEARIVDICQKMGTRDVEAALHCFGDAVQHYMHEIHRKVCDDADKQQKQVEGLVEAHLGNNHA